MTEEEDALQTALQRGWIYEDALPEGLSQEQYDRWFELSQVVMGMRMGPPLDAGESKSE